MSAPESNIESNLRRLAQIKAKNPNTTHVYFKRIGLDNATIDIPVSQAVWQIRQYPKWELLTSNEEMDADVADLFKQPVAEVNDDMPPSKPAEPEVPPKPSEVKKKKPAKKAKRKKEPIEHKMLRRQRVAAKAKAKALGLGA